MHKAEAEMKCKDGHLPAENTATMAGEQPLVDLLVEDTHPLYPSSNFILALF